VCFWVVSWSGSDRHEPNSFHQSSVGIIEIELRLGGRCLLLPLTESDEQGAEDIRTE
jgi:hypothetical protein